MAYGQFRPNLAQNFIKEWGYSILLLGYDDVLILLLGYDDKLVENTACVFSKSVTRVRP